MAADASLSMLMDSMSLGSILAKAISIPSTKTSGDPKPRTLSVVLSLPGIPVVCLVITPATRPAKSSVELATDTCVNCSLSTFTTEPVKLDFF